MNGTLLTAALGLFLAAGCAHAPGDRTALKEARPQTAIVTGSHIPQRVDVASGTPATFESWPKTSRKHTKRCLLNTDRS